VDEVNDARCKNNRVPMIASKMAVFDFKGVGAIQMLKEAD
jgi:hypothetical protein